MKDTEEQENQTGMKPSTPDTIAESNLQEKLDARKNAFLAKAEREKIDAYEEGVRLVSESGVMTTALREGDVAPDFNLPAADGDSVRLYSLLEKGPVVLVWYRGGWCPYCNIQLMEYQNYLDNFKDFGAELVAISPEMPDSSLTTKEKSNLEFTVVSDPGNQVAEAYGILYTLPDIVIDQFRGRLDIPAYNDDETWSLPLAVTYLIDKDAEIKYSFIDADYRKRAEPADVLNEILKLQNNP